MKPADFVYKSILETAMGQGALIQHATLQAEVGRAKYRRNEFTKASSLILDCVKEAVKETKKFQKSQMGQRHERSHA